MNAPFLTPNEVGRITAMHIHEGVPVVLATGCFDVLHIGHLNLLEQAATYGTLFVGINTDEAVRQLKGPSRPINKLEDRAMLLGALRCVHSVFPIDSTTVESAIRLVQPNYWIKGSGYTIYTLNQDEVKAAREVGAEIVLVPEMTGYSTTNILSKC